MGQKSEQAQGLSGSCEGQFFKKTQAVKQAELQDMVGSPTSQSDRVADLLKLTAKGSGIDADQKDAIATALAAMKVVSLGTGTMGTSAKTEAASTELQSWAAPQIGLLVKFMAATPLEPTARTASILASSMNAAPRLVRAPVMAFNLYTIPSAKPISWTVIPKRSFYTRY